LRGSAHWPSIIVALLTILLATSAAAQSPQPPDEGALYFYKAEVRDVHDGDTVTADIDLGFSTWLHDQKLRLYGINAPEREENLLALPRLNHVALTFT
jgi:endonuclease YncB( thermonuclease family)